MTATNVKRFVIIGENVHTTRVLTTSGKRIVVKGDRESIRYTTIDGATRFLDIPHWAKSGQDYNDGRIKHVKIAIQTGMREEEGASGAVAYLQHLSVRQELAGARFLDINVDEVSHNLEQQKEALAWLVGIVQSGTSLPVAIDSSNLELLETGLDACDAARERPMLNSASLDSLQALDLAVSYETRVVITAAGEAGMPYGDKQRVDNATRIIDIALSKGIEASDLFVDPLIFPIGVDSASGQHALDAVTAIRRRYGGEIHITGGFSNVSFGIPNRRIINDVFLTLAIDAGADSGILNPVTTDLDSLRHTNRETSTFRLAEDVLMGRDEGCRNYIEAWRRHQLSPIH